MVIAASALRSSSQALGMPSSFISEWHTQGVNLRFCGISDVHSSWQAVEKALQSYLSIILRAAR
jgi:hypothetical protein